MQGGEAGLTAALLQSLRWRLDKAATASDRCQMLASYIENDVLMLRQVRLVTQYGVHALMYGYLCWQICCQTCMCFHAS